MTPDNKELEKKNLKISFNMHDNNTPVSTQRSIRDFVKSILKKNGVPDNRLDSITNEILTVLEEYNKSASKNISSPQDDEIDDFIKDAIIDIHNKFKKFNINIGNLISKIETNKPFIGGNNEIIVDVLKVFKDYENEEELKDEDIRDIYITINKISGKTINASLTLTHVLNIIDLSIDKTKYDIEIRITRKTIDRLERGTPQYKGETMTRDTKLTSFYLDEDDVKKLPLKCEISFFIDNENNFYIQKKTTTLDGNVIKITHRVRPNIYKNIKKMIEDIGNDAKVYFENENIFKKIFDQAQNVVIAVKKPIPEMTIINKVIPSLLDMIAESLESAMISNKPSPVVLKMGNEYTTIGRSLKSNDENAGGFFASQNQRIVLDSISMFSKARKNDKKIIGLLSLNTELNRVELTFIRSFINKIFKQKIREYSMSSFDFNGLNISKLIYYTLEEMEKIGLIELKKLKERVVVFSDEKKRITNLIDLAFQYRKAIEEIRNKLSYLFKIASDNADYFSENNFVLFV